MIKKTKYQKLYYFVRGLKKLRCTFFLSMISDKGNSALKGWSIERAFQYLNNLYLNARSHSFGKSLITDKNYDLQIIVPAYNCESTIKDCLASIYNQKTKYKIRIVVVDDGSIDKTAQILDDLSEKHPCIKIVHQENQGFSGARNTGLKNITAKYVMFVDSDDKLENGSIDALIDYAQKYKADIVQGSYRTFSDERIGKIEGNDFEKNADPYRKLNGYPWGKIFKSVLFSDVIFPEHYWFEDTMLAYRVFPKAKKVVIIKKLIYNYRVNPQGVTNYSRGKLKTIDTLWITLSLLEDYIQENRNVNNKIFEFTLKQISVNTMRLMYLNDDKVNYSNFVLSKYILNKYFNSLNTNNNGLSKIEKALRNNDYLQFLVSVYSYN